MRRSVATVAVLVLVVALSACGSSGGGSMTQGTSAPTTSAPGTSPPALPHYQPSTVVSESSSHIQLTSPDSVSKISAFYQSALAQGGWSIVTSSTNPYSGNFTAKRGHEGVTLAISPSGPSGSTISISTYPT